MKRNRWIGPSAGASIVALALMAWLMVVCPANAQPGTEPAEVEPANSGSTGLWELRSHHLIFGMPRQSVLLKSGPARVWLHVKVRRPSPFYAEATAWTTSSKAASSKRVKVGSIRLALNWCGGSEDSTKKKTASHKQYQYIFGICAKKAKATAWCKNPSVGPVTVEA